MVINILLIIILMVIYKYFSLRLSINPFDISAKEYLKDIIDISIHYSIGVIISFVFVYTVLYYTMIESFALFIFELLRDYQVIREILVNII